MTDADKEFLRKLRVTFRGEAEEHLQEIISNIVLLEQAGDGARSDVVQHILKTLHTLKGAARSVNLNDLETLCHAMESVFSAILKSGRSLRSEQFDVVHQASSLARLLMDEPSGRERNQSVGVGSQLNRISKELLAPGETVKPQAAMSDSAGASRMQPDNADHPDAVPALMPEAVKTDVVRVHSNSLDGIRHQVEALLTVELGMQHHVTALLELAEEMAEQRRRVRVAESGMRGTSRKKRQPTPAEVPRTDAHLLRSVDDAQSASGEPYRDNSGFELQCRRLADALSQTRRNFVTIRSRLMDATLETALVPFSSALEQLPGLVRNLARSRGKEIALNIQGGSTLIDRRVLDSIREALMHLVTNAVDHGIEPTERRILEGKPAAGEIRIKVLQRDSNRIAVTIADDGGGIDVAAVADAAIKSGSLTADQLAGLDGQQRLQVILKAGVSTSRQVTQVSGRGVGLAIVAEKVASVGGDLLIENFPGAGCMFELQLPVRLATLRGLVLRTAGSRYVFPLSGIDTVRAIKSGDIQTVENRETLLVGKRVIPAVRLGQLLGVRRSAYAQGVDEGIALIVRTGGNLFALLVDEIIAEQEVLPKSLGKQLRRVRCITGATQLGDGGLVPILGLEDIAKYGLATGDGAIFAPPASATASAAKRVLVVEDSITSRLLLKHILEGAGYRVDTAVDGLDALSKLRHGDFDAVVSDVEMPRMDGFTLTESIRGNSKTEEMPVILVTSLQSPEEKERGLHAGADAYVIKGAFDQDNLVATIRRLI